MINMIGATTNTPIILVGKEGTNKRQQALEILDDPIIRYANEYDIDEIFSIPINRGILIEEVDYKPNTKLIIDSILKYRGTIVLTSLNQKDIPKTILKICKIKRAGPSLLREQIKSMAIGSDEPEEYTKNNFELLHEVLKNKDREDVKLKLVINKPSEVTMLSWLSGNLHPAKIAYLDSKVKWKWSKDYFYALLAYSHNGVMNRAVKIPSKRTYNHEAKICAKLGLKRHEGYILEQLKQDPVFIKYMNKKLNHTQKRIAKIEKVKTAKAVDTIQTLDKWM